MFLSLYSTWLSIYTFGLMLLPISLVQNWRKRNSSDGFSAVNMLMGTMTNILWLKHALMTENYVVLRTNGMTLIIVSFYLFTFAYYQSDRTTFYRQISAVALLALTVFSIASFGFSGESATHFIGSFASFFQSLRIFASVYEIKRTISLKTTEYLPAKLQFAFFFFFLQWIIFGLLTSNYYLVIAHSLALVSTIATISLYFFYPPLTWTVPILNIPPQKAKDEDEKSKNE